VGNQAVEIVGDPEVIQMDSDRISTAKSARGKPSPCLASVWTNYSVPIPSARDFVFPSERERLEELVRTEMEQVYKLAVPLVVEIGVGPNWRDLD
jgi:hypothetical protein